MTLNGPATHVSSRAVVFFQHRLSKNLRLKTSEALTEPYY